jgi:hypothetical protein
VGVAAGFAFLLHGTRQLPASAHNGLSRLGAFGEATVDRETLVRKLNNLLDAAERDQEWGKIEIEIKQGVPILLHHLVTEKINEVNTTNGGRRTLRTYNADQFSKHS